MRPRCGFTVYARALCARALGDRVCVQPRGRVCPRAWIRSIFCRFPLRLRPSPSLSCARVTSDPAQGVTCTPSRDAIGRGCGYRGKRTLCGPLTPPRAMPFPFPSKAFGGEVTYQVADGVAVVTMSASQRMNTFSSQMLQGLAYALDIAAEDATINVVVLTGAGTRAFSAGGNLTPDAADGAASGFKQGDGRVPVTVDRAVRQLRCVRAACFSLTARCVAASMSALIQGALGGVGPPWCGAGPALVPSCWSYLYRALPACY